MKRLFFTLTFLFFLNGVAIAQNSEHRTLQEEIEKNESQLNQKKEQQQKTKRSLSYLKRELSLENKRLRRAQYKLYRTTEKAKQTKEELSSIRSQYSDLSKKVEERLVAIYKQENLGMISFVFSPKDYEKALTQSHYFEKLLESDTKLLTELNLKKEAYLRKRTELEDQELSIRRLRNQISVRQKQLKAKKSRVQYSLREIERDIAEFERLNNLLKEESKQFEGIIKTKTTVATTAKKFLATGYFQRPTKGWISSRYGYRRHPIFKRRILHAGIDFAAPKGKPIYAADNGTVIFSGWKKGYGNVIIIDHGWKDNKNYSTLYAHQSRRIVTKGATVNKGKLIGYVGSTGYSTGPHLHFELRENGRPINPTKFLKL